MEKNKMSSIPTETSKTQSKNWEGKALAEIATDQNPLISVKDDKEHTAKTAKIKLEQNIRLVAGQMKVSRELASKVKVGYLYRNDFGE